MSFGTRFRACPVNQSVRIECVVDTLSTFGVKGHSNRCSTLSYGSLILADLLLGHTVFLGQMLDDILSARGMSD